MASQQLPIKSLETKHVTTKFGEKEVWIVNGKWQSFKGGWNKDWTVSGVAKGVFETKQNGQYTNYNIACPPELKQQFQGQRSNENTELLTEIANNVLAILTILKDAQGDETTQSVDPTPVPSDEPTPVNSIEPTPTTEQEINIENIPF